MRALALFAAVVSAIVICIAGTREHPEPGPEKMASGLAFKPPDDNSSDAPILLARGRAPQAAPNPQHSRAVWAPLEQAVESDPAQDALQDAPEVGPHKLQIYLVDAATGEAPAGRVALWRRGLAATEHWTAGDRIHASRTRGQRGWLVEDLPAGSYRVEAMGAALGVVSGASFEVGTGRTFIEIAVETPPTVPVQLLVRNQQGDALLDGGLVTRGESRRSHPSVLHPPWVRPRKPITSAAAVEDALRELDRGVLDDWWGSASSLWTRATAWSDGWYRVGAVTGPSWGLRTRACFEWIKPGYARVRAFAEATADDSVVRLEATTFRRERAARLFLLPSGQPMTATAETLRAVVVGQPVGGGRIEAVELTVQLDGYQRLERTFDSVQAMLNGDPVTLVPQSAALRARGRRGALNEDR